MRAMLMACALMAAAPCYAGCNETLITLEKWNLRPIDSVTNEITVTFRSNAAKPIRMIDASGKYVDALGGAIGSFQLNRDVQISPGEVYSETGRWGRNTFERLQKLKPSEVTATVCVRAVLYDDGTSEQF